MQYRCKHFRIEELVDKSTHDKYGDFCWNFFDDRLLKIIDFLRETLDKRITINNWLWNGRFSYRGLRPFSYKLGAKFSQHRFGRAVDFDVEGHSAQEIRDWLKVNWTPEISFCVTGSITSITVEEDVNWVHLAVQNNGEGIFNSFKP